MVHSGRKGRKGERDVAKMCEEWWRKVDKQCEFKRTPLSGGWANENIRSHFKASGDLMTTSDKWIFTVEVKRREDWSLNNLFDGKPTTAWKWWIQALDQAYEEDNEPMLWLKRNAFGPTRPVPWLVFVSAEFAKKAKLPEPDVKWSKAMLVRNKVDYGDELPVIYMAERFLKISPRIMLKNYKED
jgi:hypothetical protein